MKSRSLHHPNLLQDYKRLHFARMLLQIQGMDDVKVKMGHVDGPQHINWKFEIVGSLGSHHGNMTFLRANDNLIDFLGS